MFTLVMLTVCGVPVYNGSATVNSCASVRWRDITINLNCMNTSTLPCRIILIDTCASTCRLLE